MKRWLILFTAVCLVLSGVASASVQQGDTELNFTAGLTSWDGDDGLMGEDFDEFFISGGLGYFINDNVQLGVSAGVSWAEANKVDTDALSLGVFGKYHFMPTNQWVPYVGFQLDWTDVEVDYPGATPDEQYDGIMWGPLVGLRYELNAYNDFYVQYEYQLFEGDLGKIWEDGHSLVVGLIHQFK
jgi:outer membrane protein with beta-barrel domain